MVEGLFQPLHLIIILAIVLVVFGPGKIANLGGAMGKSIKEFKENTADPQPSASPEGPVASLSTSAAMNMDSKQKVVASDPSNV